MSGKFETIEVFVMVDADGQYVAATSESGLPDAWDAEYGDMPTVSRTLRLSLSVELPTVTTLSADVPNASAAATLTVKP